MSSVFVIGVVQQGIPRCCRSQLYLLRWRWSCVSDPALIFLLLQVLLWRAASDRLENSFLTVLFQPALYIASVIYILFSIVPGFPRYPSSFYPSERVCDIGSKKQRTGMEVAQPRCLSCRFAIWNGKLEALLPLDLMVLEIGYGLTILSTNPEGSSRQN